MTSECKLLRDLIKVKQIVFNTSIAQFFCSLLHISSVKWANAYSSSYQNLFLAIESLTALN